MSKIKQLQNNFTTPEQSKRLLELGVPAKSADCFWSNHIESKMYASPIVRHKISYRYKDWFKTNHYFYTPCWSVGRLMEIINICVPSDEELAFTYYDDMIDGLIERIKEERVDFSKLEE